MSKSSSNVGLEGIAKATVEDRICQAVQSTSNLLHLMQEASPSQALLAKLPKNLLAKAATIKNTGQVLEQLPVVISSLDSYMENSLQNLPHVGMDQPQELENMQSCISTQQNSYHDEPMVRTPSEKEETSTSCEREDENSFMEEECQEDIKGTLCSNLASSDSNCSTSEHCVSVAIKLGKLST